MRRAHTPAHILPARTGGRDCLRRVPAVCGFLELSGAMPMGRVAVPVVMGVMMVMIWPSAELWNGPELSLRAVRSPRSPFLDERDASRSSALPCSAWPGLPTGAVVCLPCFCAGNAGNRLRRVHGAPPPGSLWQGMLGGDPAVGQLQQMLGLFYAPVSGRRRSAARHPLRAFWPTRPATRCAGESIRQEPGRPQGPSRTGQLPTEGAGISLPTRRGWRPHRRCQAPRRHRRRRASRRRVRASRVRPLAGGRRTGCP